MVDYCISNSDFETGAYQSSVWKGKQVLETGHPRNDVLFATESVQKEKAAKVRKFYKIPKDSRIVLYAPTYREKFMHGKEWGGMDFQALREALSRRFGGEFTVLARTHRKDRGKWPEVESSPEVINANNYPELTELMLSCDVAVTDYSSWIYDFLFLGRPGFLYAPNAREYQEKRGLCYSLEDTPFPVASNMAELLGQIHSFHEEEYKERAQAFLKEKGCKETGTACQSLVEHFRREME